MKQKDILVILVLTFLVVVMWIMLNIIHAQHESTISEDLSQQIVQIDGSFDTHTIDMLKAREQVQPLYEAAVASQSATTAQVASTPTPVVTQKQTPAAVNSTKILAP